MNNTEEKMIEAATLWIEKNGYQDISLRKLVKQLDLTTGAFYKHFESKNALYFKVSQVLSSKLVKKLSPDPSNPAITQLVDITRKFSQEFDVNPNVMDFLFIHLGMSDLYDEDTHKFLFLDTTKRLIHQINQSGESDDIVFRQILAFIQGYSILVRNKAVTFNEHLVETTIHEFIS